VFHPIFHPSLGRDIVRQYGLSAQLTIRAISKTIEAYKRDMSIQPMFLPEGAIVCDSRILSFVGLVLVVI